MVRLGILLSTIIVVDVYLYSKGYKSFFHSRKTDDEKEI